MAAFPVVDIVFDGYPATWGRGNLKDTILPLFMGITGFLMFAILEISVMPFRA